MCRACGLVGQFIAVEDDDIEAGARQRRRGELASQAAADHRRQLAGRHLTPSVICVDDVAAKSRGHCSCATLKPP
jgi:hypothetical protein